MIDRRLPTVLIVIGLGLSSLTSTRSAESSDLTPVAQMENADNPKFLESLPADFEYPTDEAGELLLREYGAVYVARNGAVPPKRVFFESEAEVEAFQKSVDRESEKIGGIKIELQKPAMRALEDAVKDAKKRGLTISPRGSDSGRRGYNQTIALWKSRVEPGLVHWAGKGRVKAVDAARIRNMPVRQQIAEVLRLEKEGIFFAKSLDKSIIYSVAPPGSSQHIAMLALDVKEFDDARVRAVLANHGWFQTVVSDLPHFTYLGVDASDLPDLGLKMVKSSGRDFWVPDLSSSTKKKVVTKNKNVSKP